MNQIQTPYNRINQHDIFNEKMSSQPKQEERKNEIHFIESRFLFFHPIG